MDKDVILSKLASQRQLLENNPLKHYKNRKKALKRLYKNIKLMQDEICEALKIDLNKSKEESYMAEIGMVLAEISYMIKHCRRFAKTKRVLSPISQFP